MNHMHVFHKGKLIVIETNLDFALPYWTARKRLFPKTITWVIK